MKKCFKCKKNKPGRLFYRHPQMEDGLLGKCKKCTRIDVHENYLKNRDYFIAYEKERNKRPERKRKIKEYNRRSYHRYPGKAKARSKINHGIRDGHVIRKPCEKCGSLKSEAHHPDYRRPLYVRWLCLFHHREEEGKTAK